LLVVAVRVTLPSTAALAVLAPSEAVQPLFANVGVHRSPTPVALVPLLVVVVTWTVEEPAGATAVSEVADRTETPLAGTLPNATRVVLSKPLPVTVTVVPPVDGPEPGLSAVTVGAPGAAVGVGEATVGQLRVPASRRTPSVPTNA
jgi:hypothetical protein